MDAENGELYFADVEEDGVTGDNWNLDSVDTKLVCSDVIFTNPEKQLADWEVDPHCGLNDSESEDVLHAINPNEVFPSGSLGETLSESDSGISEDPVEGPAATAIVEQAHQAHATIYQVVYDVSSLGHVKAEQNVDVISIQLDDWNSQMLISESCIVNELPIVSANQLDNSYAVAPSVSSTAPSSPESSLLFPDLRLTEEEQKLLNQEGISLPNNLPLTKAEERILKKVRRKIRNKQSAQDSRRRRKEYIDGLESRAAACSAQNKELQRTVEQLEKHNMSLLAQLRRLQSLIKQTVTKAAQTSTCILIIIFSLGLIILPSYSPFSRVSSLEDNYKPKGVISRNILTDPASFQQVVDEADSPAIQTDSLPIPPDLNQSGSLDSADVLKQPVENPEIRDLEVVVQEESQLGNSSSLAGEQTDSLAFELTSMAGKGGPDPAKPAHADEM